LVDSNNGLCDVVLAKKKDQHRFDGRGKFDTSQVPTYDLIQGKETIA
jgi:hypothetical protein